MFTLWLALTSSAGADTPVSPVVVAADRTPAAIDQLGSDITLITAQAIANSQWRDLPSLLLAQPGLDLVQTGGPGGQTSVFIRGAEARHTKVRIDGIDVNDPSEGAFDFGQTLTGDIASVEIVRGPQSSLYGSDALGGVIDIRTRRGEGRPTASLSVEGGSFDTLNETLAASGGLGRVGVSATLQHAYSGDTPVTPPGLLAPGETRIGDRYDNVTASGRLDVELSRVFSLGSAARWVRGDLRTTGENYTVYPAIPDAAQTRQLSHQVFLRQEVRADFAGGRANSVLGVAYTRYETTIRAPDDGFGPPPPTVNNGDRLKLDFLSSVALTRNLTLVAGAEDERDRLTGDAGPGSDETRGGFAELRAAPLAGLQLDGSVRRDEDDRFGGVTTWRLSGSWTAARLGTRLKAVWGTGFKAPTLTQLFVSYPSYNFFANPDLRPETSEGYELGVEQPLASGRVRIGATWHYMIIRGLITTNATFTSWTNIGRATTSGIESFVSWRPDASLDLRADYTHDVARDELAQQDLLRRPRDKVSLGGTWKPNARLTVSATWIYVGAWVDGNRDFSIPRLKASPYATANLAASLDLGRGVTAFWRIDDLFDRHWQNPVGFDKPGLGAFGGLKATFR